MVPASSFGCPGYVRIAYCVSYETIVNSLPHFAEVAKEMGVIIICERRGLIYEDMGEEYQKS